MPEREESEKLQLFVSRVWQEGRVLRMSELSPCFEAIAGLLFPGRRGEDV
jgi:hypothetical protein